MSEPTTTCAACKFPFAAPFLHEYFPSRAISLVQPVSETRCTACGPPGWFVAVYLGGAPVAI